jgi:hypothetical protein
MLPLIVGAAAAIGSAIYGGIKSAKARKSQQKLIDGQRKSNEEWYNKNYYADYMQNADVQSGLSRLRDQIALNNRRIAGAAAMSGGTDEAKLAAQAEGNRTYADAIRGIAGQATAYKRGIDAQNQQNQQNVLGMMMNMYSQDAANANQLSQNGMNAGAGLMQTSSLFSRTGQTGKNSSNYGGTGMSFDQWRQYSGYVYGPNGSLEPGRKNGN